MNLIKNAFIYKVSLPARAALANHLQGKAFVPMTPAWIHSTGFVVNETTAEMATPIEGGYSFTLRHDEKVIPAAAVNAKLAARVAEIKQTEIRNPGRKEKTELKEAIIANMACVAFSKSTLVNAFYQIDTGYLIVATASKAIAERVMGYLVEAVGSIKFESIVISELKHVLTTRLENNMRNERAEFQPFWIGSSLVLKGPDGKKIAVQTYDIHAATQGIIEAIDDGCQVDRIELGCEACTFKLTSDFRLTGIKFDDAKTEKPEDIEHAADIWRHEAGIAMLLISHAVKDLCDLFGYKPAAAEAV